MNYPPIGLLAAIHAETISPETWKAWADREILRTEQPPMWIIDLSIANDFSEAWKAIGESVQDTESLPSAQLDEAALGLISLNYLKGGIDFCHYLRRAGDHTDPSSCSTDCEYFYHHLNGIESSSNPEEYERMARSEIEQYLAEAIELGKIAQAQIKPITEPVDRGNG
ncbi:hypothetical protein QEH52_19225 [Coraliomargarita sp. SDUM461003]|uniref:DUF4375 domain-containing protein n=1 Tax=Thalassobacterium maritimum TaxID=3041265 RepID=A0ABU1AZR8_9BACT|nr:hypothetical protein [Coraliomargarita sp. SDUM461003]MDQ8209659.1 hypothetical protein [Coraliomargarita sp. SDUM461003]